MEREKQMLQYFQSLEYGWSSYIKEQFIDLKDRRRRRRDCNQYHRQIEKLHQLELA